MDVAVSDWATSEMGPAGPTSVKSASLMKNSLILVTKHCKKKRETHENEGITISFSSFFSLHLAGLLFHHAMTTKTIRNSKLQRQKESTRKPRRTPLLRLDFLSFAALFSSTTIL
jgi:hypothetical protein